MFDAEKLLGQMMGDAFSGSLGGKKRKHKRSSSGLSGLMGGMSTGTKAKIGVGLLGLAYAAYEHYKQPAAAATTGALPSRHLRQPICKVRRHLRLSPPRARAMKTHCI